MIPNICSGPSMAQSHSSSGAFAFGDVDYSVNSSQDTKWFLLASVLMFTVYMLKK